MPEPKVILDIAREYANSEGVSVAKWLTDHDCKSKHDLAKLWDIIVERKRGEQHGNVAGDTQQLLNFLTEEVESEEESQLLPSMKVTSQVPVKRLSGNLRINTVPFPVSKHPPLRPTSQRPPLDPPVDRALDQLEQERVAQQAQLDKDTDNAMLRNAMLEEELKKKIDLARLKEEEDRKSAALRLEAAQQEAAARLTEQEAALRLEVQLAAAQLKEQEKAQLKEQEAAAQLDKDRRDAQQDRIDRAHLHQQKVLAEAASNAATTAAAESAAAVAAAVATSAASAAAAAAAGQDESHTGISTLATIDNEGNSQTHASEYRAFIREAQNRKKMPVGLAPNFKNDRLDLFNLWRKNDKDWHQVQLSITRRATKLTESKGTKSMIKMRDLTSKGMPYEKAKALRDKRKAQGLAEWDVDFPEDPEEMKFWQTTEISSTEINRTEESIEINAKKDMSDLGEIEEYIGSDGILAAGMRVASSGISDKNAASFAESMTNMLAADSEMKVKMKAVVRVTAQSAAPPEMTDKEIAGLKSEEIKKESTVARAYGMTLSAHKICPDTAAEMDGHADALDKQYRALTNLIKQHPPASALDYIDPMEKIDALQKWFIQNEGWSKKMCQGVKIRKIKDVVAKPESDAGEK